MLAKFFGYNETQPIQDRLAENRAIACKEALAERGVPADQLVVTFKGCGGQSKVDFIPMHVDVAIEKLRSKLAEQKANDVKEISALKAGIPHEYRITDTFTECLAFL